jgi:aconitate hydratase
VEPSLAGPRRPQDRVALSVAAPAYAGELMEFYKKGGDFGVRYSVAKADGSPEAFDLGHGDVVIAAITSCTNTSNPSVLVAAGLVAKKARALGLARKPWVKSSLAPGSQVVTDYLNKADLTQHLDALGFNLVGYGCTTCIGNSGPLPEAISKVINEKDLVACSVISGNRNFEGRVSPDVKANYLASPPLVVAYALAGSMKINITSDPIGMGSNGQPVYLRDIWPTNREIEAAIAQCITSDMFKARYANVFKGDDYWQKVKTSSGMTYDWNPSSTYVKHPPYFQGMSMAPTATVDIKGARLLAVLGDSITTDHISPAGNIKAKSPAGAFLMDRQVPASDFNSYGARRGNDDVMVRGTFANIRIRNDMTPGVEGGVTTSPNTGEVVPIYDAAQEFAVSHTPLMIIAGKEYGTGSSRDWAAKGTNLLGVKAVLAESFERIHRSNLVGMAVLPLQFKDGMTRAALKLNGTESFDIPGMTSLKPLQDMEITMTRTDGSAEKFTVMSRIDTANEVEYFYNGGVLPYVLRKLAA